jgi:hypothetical protein
MVFKKIFKVESKEDPSNKRGAVRVQVPGLRAKVLGRKSTYAVADLSHSGIALHRAGKDFRRGDTIQITLFKGGAMKATALKAQVVREFSGNVGCVFTALDRRQTKILHELVLEEQKKAADFKKKRAPGDKGDKTIGGGGGLGGPRFDI